MTTIAFDGRYLAADRLMVFNDGEACPVPMRKIDVVYRHGSAVPEAVVASTGLITAAWRAALAQWWLDGHSVQEMPPAGAREDAGSFVVIQANGSVELFSYFNPYGVTVGALDAWGSGGEYAIGAMLMGGSAMQAVDAASKRCIRTGGGVDFIDLRDLGAGVQAWTPPDELLDPTLMHGLSALGNALEPVAAKGGTSGWVTVGKPRKASGNDGEGWRTPECTGRLALGTGCGHCLRCNREWYVLLKGGRVMVTGPDRIEVPLGVAWLDASPPEPKLGDHLPRTPINPDGVAIGMTVAEALADLVSQWNSASERGDRVAMQTIDRAFREFGFPPGVEMVTDQPGNEHNETGRFRRRLIWQDGSGAA